MILPSLDEHWNNILHKDYHHLYHSHRLLLIHCFLPFFSTFYLKVKRHVIVYIVPLNLWYIFYLSFIMVILISPMHVPDLNELFFKWPIHQHKKIPCHQAEIFIFCDCSSYNINSSTFLFLCFCNQGSTLRTSFIFLFLSNVFWVVFCFLFQIFHNIHDLFHFTI